LKLLPVFIFFIPAVLLLCLLQKGMPRFLTSNLIMHYRLVTGSSVGLKASPIAGLLAALMSSLFIASTLLYLFRFDFYKQQT